MSESRIRGTTGRRSFAVRIRGESRGTLAATWGLVVKMFRGRPRAVQGREHLMATRKIPMEPEAANTSGRSGPVTEIVNAFSVDVEEYFHDETFRQLITQDQWDDLDQRVEPSTTRILELLDEFGVKGTFFVLGWVAERHPDLVRDIHNLGHEVGIHGYDHRPITVLTRDEFRRDIRKAKTIVEDLISDPILGYRAPTFSLVEKTKWAFEILIEEGIRYDSSVFPIVHDRYGIPTADRYPYVEQVGDRQLLEFPMSTIRLAGRNLPFVGGGYTRLLPMPLVRWGMRSGVGREKRPMILYVHPWEVDPGHPVLGVGRVGRTRHYHGLAKVEPRLRELLGSFRFGTVREVLGI